MPNELTHHYSRLIEIFNDCFRTRYNTVLVAGDDEPYYEPGRAASLIRLYLLMAFLRQRCMRLRTGALPVKSAGNSSITATGTNPMAAMNSNSANLNRLNESHKRWNGCFHYVQVLSLT